jgi:hypothetical protein
MLARPIFRIFQKRRLAASLSAPAGPPALSDFALLLSLSSKSAFIPKPFQRKRLPPQGGGPQGPESGSCPAKPLVSSKASFFLHLFRIMDTRLKFDSIKKPLRLFAPS